MHCGECGPIGPPINAILHCTQVSNQISGVVGACCYRLVLCVVKCRAGLVSCDVGVGGVSDWETPSAIDTFARCVLRVEVLFLHHNIEFAMHGVIRVEHLAIDPGHFVVV